MDGLVFGGQVTNNMSAAPTGIVSNSFMKSVSRSPIHKMVAPSFNLYCTIGEILFEFSPSFAAVRASL